MHRTGYALYRTSLRDESRDFVFKNRQIRSCRDNLLHPKRILALVALHARGLYRRTPACVQRLELQTAQICIHAHFAAQRIQFTHQMRFGKSANRWITWHHRNRRALPRDQYRAAAHARRHKRCLSARMAATDHQDIIRECLTAMTGKEGRGLIHRVPSIHGHLTDRKPQGGGLFIILIVIIILILHDHTRAR